MLDQVDDQTERTVGEPVTFLSGPFSQQTLRIELRVIQEASFCRKTSLKDRRTLEPPPVLVLCLHSRITDEQGNTTESPFTDYRSTPYVGFVANVDIFEAPLDTATEPIVVVPPNPDSPETPLVYATIGRHPLTQASVATPQLAGSTFASALSLPLADSHSLVFAFGDLSCRKEGLFVPRYRCMHVAAQVAGAMSFPVLAEVWGRPFRVYSTSEQPPLPASTELTKELLRLGVPVHARTKEKQGKKKRKKSVPASKEQGSDDGTQSQSDSG